MKSHQAWKIKRLSLALSLALTGAAVTGITIPDVMAADAPITAIAGVNLKKYSPYIEHATEFRIGKEVYAF